jgi:lipopolysaccharide transport system permease protein
MGLLKLNAPFHFSPGRQRTLDLLWLLTQKEVTLRYKRTTLGILWSLLNPLLLALVYYFAFKVIIRFRVDNYAFFLLSALFAWTWFAASVNMSTGSLVGNASLIKKVNFPRHLLVFATVAGQLANFLFTIPIIFGLAYLQGPTPSLVWLLGIPVLIVAQLLLTGGIGLALSMLNAYFRDLQYTVNFLVHLLFWLTPIIYPAELIPDRYRFLFQINPVALIITAWRDLFLNHVIDWTNVGLAYLISLSVLALGILTFRVLGKKLDEFL